MSCESHSKIRDETITPDDASFSARRKRVDFFLTCIGLVGGVDGVTSEGGCDELCLISRRWTCELGDLVLQRGI